MITIIHGANRADLDTEGLTVGVLRKKLRDVLNHSASATALIQGLPVSDQQPLTSGDKLEFLSEFGIKGLGRILSKSQLCNELGVSEGQYEHMLKLGLPILDLGDGEPLHSEVAIDHFFVTSSEKSNHDKPNIVDSDHVARMLNCSPTWICDLARRGEIPATCVVLGTGQGKPWKFYRTLIEKWVRDR